MELMPEPDHDVKQYNRYSKCMRFAHREIKEIKGIRVEGNFMIKNEIGF